MVSIEKFKVLAEKYGWSVAHAKGFVAGESYRRRGKRPPTQMLIGIDEYTALARSGDGEWNVRGLGSVTYYSPGGEPVRYNAGESFASREVI